MKRKGIAIFILITMLFSIHTIVFADDETNISDIDNHWAKENINVLVGKGIIKGYTDGTFKPNNNVSVSEAVKMLITSLGIDPGNASKSEGHWATNYMVEAMDRKYILGDELTNWDRPITRGELARIIVRALDEKYEENIEEYSSQIKDYEKIDNEFKEYVLKAYVKGIITGYPDGTFKPDNNITRAEASTMLIRFLEPNERCIPEIIEKPIIDGDDTFVEPEIEVFYFEGKWDYQHFTFILENAEEYKGAVEHTFVTECISHPNINLVYAKGVDGKFMDKKINMIEHQKKVSPKFEGGSGIYALGMKNSWKPVNGSFEGKDGEKMQYKVTVSNGKTTKEYIIDVKFNDRKFN